MDNKYIIAIVLFIIIIIIVIIFNKDKLTGEQSDENKLINKSIDTKTDLPDKNEPTDTILTGAKEIFVNDMCGFKGKETILRLNRNNENNLIITKLDVDKIPSSIKSIKIPSGRTVQIFSMPNFGGVSKIYNNNVNCLGDIDVHSMIIS